MDHLELIVLIRPYSEEIKDILVADLSQIGFSGFLEEDESLRGYLPFPEFNQKLMYDTLNGFGLKGVQLDIQTRIIPAQNWNHLWESNFKPVIIDRKCLVRAPFHSPVPGIKYELVIEPKMSFGTGHHATTRLMVSEIMKLQLEGKTILDMGTGTGILAILASMKGAKQITAIDIDPWALENCKENIQRNQAENIELISGDTSKLKKSSFDAVFANINKPVIVSELMNWINLTKNGGFIIISGILMEDATEIRKLIRKKLKLIKHRHSGSWILMLLQKNLL